ncbi:MULTISPECIES: LysR family transcriptional regulator [Clostridiaceae]|uniref:LysR family transcriptional regulator n=1 Tax=Clostridium facile TaxID=2763035 RepID=A0ABR7IRA3_9CLOT|nr:MULTISPECIES: LysR family transcriptional regulator [Clostridiaceae]MBC5787657.1 LysR family transcriptional regulator [Clostridium facile]PWM99105.1 MAG: LysR family transcriptional regulator [Massilioclostridium sp.]
MTLQQLRYIIEIVNSGSMSAASEKLFLTQPSLSMTVKELEQELGIEIFLRTNRGISLTNDGVEFLAYARQVVEQVDLLESRYHTKKPSRRIFSVSTQHYAFSVNAFVNLVKEYNHNEYEFTLRETKTHEIIEDVKEFRSEIGVLFLSSFNQKVIKKNLRESGLVFHPLFEAKAHVFISKNNPLAQNRQVTLKDLQEYPCLSFEQGQYNSAYYSEELLSNVCHPKNIMVSDRATLFNLLIGLNGYTISTGILSEDLNGKDIVSVPLNVEERMTVGYIVHKNIGLSKIALSYIEKLQHYIFQQLNEKMKKLW